MKTIFITGMLFIMALSARSDELSTLRAVNKQLTIENVALKKELAILKNELATLKGQTLTPQVKAQIAQQKRAYATHLVEYKKLANEYKILNKEITTGILNLRKNSAEYKRAQTKLISLKYQMDSLKNRALACKATVSRLEGK